VRLSDGTLRWLLQARRVVNSASEAIPDLPIMGPCGNGPFGSAGWERAKFSVEIGLRLSHYSAIVRGKGWEESGEGKSALSAALATDVATCRTLHDLQSLYMVPMAPTSSARIEAQAQLIAALLRLNDALDTWTYEPYYISIACVVPEAQRDSNPRFGWHAYLLRELELAKQVGALPLAANEALASI
jgi:hypothetical protein